MVVCNKGIIEIYDSSFKSVTLIYDDNFLLRRGTFAGEKLKNVEANI